MDISMWWTMIILTGKCMQLVEVLLRRYTAKAIGFSLLTLDLIKRYIFHKYLILLLIEEAENVALYLIFTCVYLYVFNIYRLLNMKMHLKANGEIGIGDRKGICCWTELISGNLVPELRRHMQELLV